MKQHIVRTIAFAILSLGLAATASAKDDHTCSLRGVAGDWGYSLQGTLFLPPNAPGPVPVAFIGTLTTDADGNLSGAQTSNVGGAVAQDILTGTVTVNSDCTGEWTVNIFDQSHTLLRTAVWALVWVDDGTESRGTFKSLVLPDGTNVRAVAIAEGKRVFRNHGQEK